MRVPADARLVSLATALVALVCFAPGASADGRDHRSHVTLAAGYETFTGGDFVDESLEDAPLAHFAFRQTIRRGLDFAFEFRGTWASEDIGPIPAYPYEGSTATATTIWTGAGLRFSSHGDGPRVYGQFNLYFLSQNLNLKNGFSEFPEKNTGYGVGVHAGVDVPVSDLLSIPVEANLLTGDAEGRMTCVGASVGLTFNFGRTLDGETQPRDF